MKYKSLTTDGTDSTDMEWVKIGHITLPIIRVISVIRGFRHRRIR